MNKLNSLKKQIIYLFRKNSKKTYFLIYTIAFILLSIFVFWWHIWYGRTLIMYGDGWGQHYPALIYYGKYLRTIFKTLFYDGKLIIPKWDFHIGEGGGYIKCSSLLCYWGSIKFIFCFCPS